MANFLNLNKSCIDLTTQCVNNNNKQDIALFIITQDKLIREQNIKNKNSKESNNNQSNNTVDRKTQALNRLKSYMQ